MRMSWVITALIIWILVALGGRHIRFHPGRSNGPDDEVRARLGAVDVHLRTRDGLRLHGWWIERPGAAFTTLYLHGNGGYVTIYEPLIEPVLAAGHSLLIIDYRGYGRSEGSPSESGLYEDARTALQWLLARGVTERNLVIHGMSLGTAVALELAQDRKCAGVVLDAPFSSMRDIAHTKFPLVGFTLPLGFESWGKIGRLKAPLLVFHGDQDPLIHIELGQRLFALAPDPKEFVMIPGGGHDDLPQAGGVRYREKLHAFYRRLR
jgi:pimeloyl-ACP methyl ester carboxylesterase